MAPVSGVPASLLVFGSIVNIKFKNYIFTTREGWSAVLRNVRPNRVRVKDVRSPLGSLKLVMTALCIIRLTQGVGRLPNF